MSIINNCVDEEENIVLINNNTECIRGFQDLKEVFHRLRTIFLSSALYPYALLNQKQ
jgi:hypothetical protein